MIKRGYYPFGLKHKGYNNVVNGVDHPYGYNGKEEQDELGLNWLDFSARNYDAALGRFMNIDPMGELPQNISFSPYNYVKNNPIKFVDPDGRDVSIRFFRHRGTLHIRDNDHYEEGLETVFVSASEYKQGGIRDKDGKLTKNQVLVIKDVFSGGEADFEGNIERDPDKPAQKAIPEGEYDLTEYEGSSDWFKVDPVDSSRYDDQHQGETNSDGETRNGYRFHAGNTSHGCITVCSRAGDSDDRKKNGI